MHVCMYDCMYVCLHACVYACIHVLCMYARMYVCMYECMYLCIYVGLVASKACNRRGTRGTEGIGGSRLRSKGRSTKRCLEHALRHTIWWRACLLQRPITKHRGTASVGGSRMRSKGRSTKRCLEHVLKNTLHYETLHDIHIYIHDTTYIHTLHDIHLYITEDLLTPDPTRITSLSFFLRLPSRWTAHRRGTQKLRTTSIKHT